MSLVRTLEEVASCHKVHSRTHRVVADRMAVGMAEEGMGHSEALKRPSLQEQKYHQLVIRRGRSLLV